MSRTKKGAKSPGYEYWTARPGNRHGGLTGPCAKRRTHRAERRALIDEARDALGWPRWRMWR